MPPHSMTSHAHTTTSMEPTDRDPQERVDAILQESFAREAMLKEEFKQNLATIRAKVKGQIRKAQARNKELKELMWREQYVVRENALRRGVW